MVGQRSGPGSRSSWWTSTSTTRFVRCASASWAADAGHATSLAALLSCLNVERPEVDDDQVGGIRRGVLTWAGAGRCGRLEPTQTADRCVVAHEQLVDGHHEVADVVARAGVEAAAIELAGRRDAAGRLGDVSDRVIGQFRQQPGYWRKERQYDGAGEERIVEHRREQREG